MITLKVYSKELTLLRRYYLKIFFILTGIIQYWLTHELRVYDYIVYGSGNLTKCLIYFLSKENKSILHVIPTFEKIVVENISGTDITLTSSNIQCNESFIQFPELNDLDVKRLKYMTGLPEKRIKDAEDKLLVDSGKRYPNVYYYTLDKDINVDYIRKRNIYFFKNDNKCDRVYYNDLKFNRFKKFIFADTGNMDETMSFFWNRDTVLQPSIIQGVCNDIVKTKCINFLSKNNTDIITLYDKTYVYGYSKFAKGIPGNFKCIYDNDEINNIEHIANTMMHIGNTKYIFDPLCFGLHLTKNFKSYFNENIYCINNSVIEPNIHWKRDLLIIFILIKYL